MHRTLYIQGNRPRIGRKPPPSRDGKIHGHRRTRRGWLFAAMESDESGPSTGK